MSEKKFNSHLGLILFILIGATFWVGHSAWQEINCNVSNGWFSRSGAILVAAAIFSSLITRPFVYDHTFPNLVNILDHGVGRAELEEEHWAKKVGLFKILAILELVLAIAGTIIWAYGDLWFSKCQ